MYFPRLKVKNPIHIKRLANYVGDRKFVQYSAKLRIQEIVDNLGDLIVKLYNPLPAKLLCLLVKITPKNDNYRDDYNYH